MTKAEPHKTLLATIGHRIAEVRKNILHVSQQKLANQVGLKLRTVQRYEANETIPSESFYVNLSRVNKLVNINWIKTGEGYMYNLYDPSNSLSIDYDSVYTPLQEEDCNTKLKLAIAEIKMLRATLAYKDSLLNILVNQSVIS